MLELVAALAQGCQLPLGLGKLPLPLLVQSAGLGQPLCSQLIGSLPSFPKGRELRPA